MSGALRVSPPAQQCGHLIRDSALGLLTETLEPILELQQRLWSGRPLRAALVELLRLRSARSVNCVICKAVRYDVARRDGLSEEKVQALAAAGASPVLTAEEQLVVAFADAYLRTPAGLDPALLAALQRAFTAEQLRHMAFAMAFFNPMSKCAVSLGGMPESFPVTEISVPGR